MGVDLYEQNISDERQNMSFIFYFGFIKMAKREQMLRLKLIEEFIRRKKGASFQDIYEFLNEKFQEKDLELSFTERTFQRDKNLLVRYPERKYAIIRLVIFIFWKIRPKKIYSIPYC